jgi:hypothetical protein
MAPDSEQAESAGELPELVIKSAKNRPRKIPSEINFYSYPKLIFTWPLIVTAPLFTWLVQLGVYDEPLGWVYLVVLALVLLTLSIDIERNHVFMLVLAGVALFFAGAWLADAKGIPVYGAVYRWLEDLDLGFYPTFANLLAVFLAVMHGLMFVGVRFNNKWRITHNEIEHRAWGRREKAYPRIGKTFRTTYPDWMEAALCLSGSLLISDSRGDHVVEQIDNIPFLPFLARKLDRILETWSVTMREEAGVQVAQEEEENSRGF